MARFSPDLLTRPFVSTGRQPPEISEYSRNLSDVWFGDFRGEPTESGGGAFSLYQQHLPLWAVNGRLIAPAEGPLWAGSGRAAIEREGGDSGRNRLSSDIGVTRSLFTA